MTTKELNIFTIQDTYILETNEQFMTSLEEMMDNHPVNDVFSLFLSCHSPNYNRTISALDTIRARGAEIGNLYEVIKKAKSENIIKYLLDNYDFDPAKVYTSVENTKEKKLFLSLYYLDKDIVFRNMVIDCLTWLDCDNDTTKRLLSLAYEIGLITNEFFHEIIMEIASDFAKDRLQDGIQMTDDGIKIIIKKLYHSIELLMSKGENIDLDTLFHFFDNKHKKFTLFSKSRKNEWTIYTIRFLKVALNLTNDQIIEFFLKLNDNCDREITIIMYSNGLSVDSFIDSISNNLEKFRDNLIAAGILDYLDIYVRSLGFSFDDLMEDIICKKK